MFLRNKVLTAREVKLNLGKKRNCGLCGAISAGFWRRWISEKFFMCWGGAEEFMF